MALRYGTSSSNSVNHVFGTAVATLQSDQSISVWFRLNASPAAYNTFLGRKVRHATDGNSLKNWGAMLHDGTQARVQVTFFSGSSQTDIIPQTSGTGTGVGTNLSNSTWYHLLIVRSGTTCRVEVNGPSLSVIQSTTIASINNNSRNFFVGCDDNQTLVGSPVDVAELEISSTALASGSGATLYNAGVGSRIRDSFPSATLTDYYDLFTQTTATVTDKVGSANGSNLGGSYSAPSTPSSSYIDHPPMSEPIMAFTAGTGVYSDSGTTPAVDGDRIQQWSDQSGRKLHLVQTTSANKPRYNTGASFRRPGVHFDKFEFPGGTTARRTLPFPSNIRFNTRDTTIAMVYENTSGTFNFGAGNTDYYTLASLDGAGNGVVEVGRRGSGEDIGGILRSNGSSFGTGVSDALFVPSTPSLCILVATGSNRSGYINGGGTNKEATTGSAMTATGSSGQGAIGDNTGAGTDLCANGTFEAVRIWNRQLDSTARDVVTSWAVSNYSVVTTPTAIDFGIGSSSMGGNGSVSNRSPMHRLYHESSLLDNRWMFNFGNASSSLYNDTANIPSTAVYNGNTVAQVIADYAGPSVPVRVWDWTGSNDLTDDRTAAQIIADKKTMLDALISACASANARLEVVEVTVLPTDVHDASDETERLALNLLLRDTATAAGYWQYVVKHDADPDLLVASAPNWGDEDSGAGTSYRHLTDAGFGVALPYWMNPGAIFQAGARRCRARCLCRATSPLDYATS